MIAPEWGAALAQFQGFESFGHIELVDLEKAVVPKSQRRGGEPSFAGYVGGWMSTGNRDFHGDEINVDGLDCGKFLRDGWYNDNHTKDSLARYGYPVIAEIREHPQFGRSWWTEGPILQTPRGEELMTQLRALVDTDRVYGFSVEGPPPARDPMNPRRIVKALVLDAAITHRPVNEEARITLVKGLDAMPMAAVESLLAFGQHDPTAATQLLGLFKALTAGTPVANTAPGGAALQRESIGSAVQNATVGGGADDASTPRKPRKRGQTLSFDAAVDVLLEAFAAHGLTREMAIEALRRAKHLHRRTT